MLNTKAYKFEEYLHPPHLNKEVKSFWHWLHEPEEPYWIKNLDYVNTYLYEEIGMERHKVEELLKTLERYGVLTRNP